MTEQSIKPTRPFLKWAGGKFRLLKPILSHLPEGTVLVEPFVGAGALFLNAPFKRYVLSDINVDLINLYQQLQTQPALLIQEAKLLFNGQHNERTRYTKHREQFNKSDCLFERAILFIYLNRFGFNGLCRYNTQGQYNVPFGSYDKPYFPEKELHHFAHKAKKARFVHLDFCAAMKKARAGSIIYCDPPYVPLSDSASFTGYAGQSFTMSDQERLADAALSASKRGCTVLISNHDLPSTRELYEQATCSSISVQRLISAQGNKRTTVKEILALFEPR